MISRRLVVGIINATSAALVATACGLFGEDKKKSSQATALPPEDKKDDSMPPGQADQIDAAVASAKEQVDLAEFSATIYVPDNFTGELGEVAASAGTGLATESFLAGFNIFSAIESAGPAIDMQTSANHADAEIRKLVFQIPLEIDPNLALNTDEFATLCLLYRIQLADGRTIEGILSRNALQVRDQVLRFLLPGMGIIQPALVERYPTVNLEREVNPGLAGNPYGGYGNPYGGGDPYGNYGNPYGGNPYGGNTYGWNPYWSGSFNRIKQRYQPYALTWYKKVDSIKVERRLTRSILEKLLG